MGKKNESFFRKYFRERGEAIAGGAGRSYMGRTAFKLKAIAELDEMHIYKPWGLILRLLAIHYVRFGILTLLSFFPVVFFTIPVWAIVLYEFYISLKMFEKFNLSIVKTVVFSIIVECVFIAVSPFIRSGIRWLFFGLVSGSFFK